MSKILICLLFLSQNSYSFDFKKMNYELISGDDKICEDGPLLINKNDLYLGSRYIFPNFKDSKYKYSSDDKSCEYFIINKETTDSYTQDLQQVCKEKSENMNRKTVLKYNSLKELIVEITINGKLNICRLKEVKQ